MRIVDKCKGLPLAIKAMGRLLSRYTGDDDDEVWRSVLESDLWNLTATHDGKRILGPLFLSYLHLPAHIRPCFRLCSMFPKNYLIDRKYLVMLWSANGLLQEPDDGSREEKPHHLDEDVGARCIDQLLSASLFQIPNFLAGPRENRSFVTMHDLVHDLAQSLSGTECRGFMDHSFVDEQPSTDPSCATESRHLSFYGSCLSESLLCSSGNRSSILTASGLSSPVRTLLISTVYDAATPRALNRVSLGRLRLLILEKVDATTLEPAFFAAMIHLRYLRLSWTSGIHQVPATISTLYNLQVLDLSNSPDFQLLPDSLGNMKSLRELRLCHTSFNVLPDSLWELSNLQCLDLLNTRIAQLPERLGDMSALRHLNVESTMITRLPDSLGRLHELRTLGLGGAQVQCLPETLCRLGNLRELGVEQCQKLQRLPRGIGDMTSLQVLRLDFVPVSELPSGIGRLTRLRDLRTFVVGGRVNNQIAGIGELRDLKHLAGKLTIAGIRNTLTEEEAKEARLWEKTGLEQLTLHWGTRWTQCTEFYLEQDEDEDVENQNELLEQEKVLEALHPPAALAELRIGKYSGRLLPSWLQDQRCKVWPKCHFEMLSKLTIYGCPNLSSIKLQPLAPSLTELEISQSRSLQHLPLHNLSRLKDLKVKRCVALDSLGFEPPEEGGPLPSSTSRPVNRGNRVPCCPNLTVITIQDCPGLHLPPGSRMPSSLQVLHLSGCPRLDFCSLAEFPLRLNSLVVEECGECPLLVEWCHKNRSELCHVHHIRLDDDHLFLPPPDARKAVSRPANPFFYGFYP